MNESRSIAALVGAFDALCLVAVDVVHQDPRATFALGAFAGAIVGFALPRSWWISAVIVGLALDVGSFAAPHDEWIVRLLALPIAPLCAGWLAALLRDRLLPGPSTASLQLGGFLGSALGSTSWLVALALLGLVMGEPGLLALAGGSFALVVALTTFLWRHRVRLDPFSGRLLNLGAFGLAGAVGIAGLEDASPRLPGGLTTFASTSIAWLALAVVVALLAVQYVAQEWLRRRFAGEPRA